MTLELPSALDPLDIEVATELPEARRRGLDPTLDGRGTGRPLLARSFTDGLEQLDNC